MLGLSDELIEIIKGKSEFQRKYLKNWTITDQEKYELELLLQFFQKNGGYCLEYMADCYLFINDMVMEETYFFMQNGRYRNSSFREVEDSVYNNDEYMKKHMCGLSISDYIWINHIEMIRYFENKLELLSGSHYLEIGPGFGQYMIRALQSGKFENVMAVDISKTSVEKCSDYLRYRGVSADTYKVLHKNFFDFSSDERFDCIVMGEVLEHVEEPLAMLQKIHSILNDRGKVFITTAINAPTIDHIYLFSSVQDVLKMSADAGFSVCDYRCSAAGGISIEKAERKRMAVNIALVLEKMWSPPFC